MADQNTDEAQSGPVSLSHTHTDARTDAATQNAAARRAASDSNSDSSASSSDSASSSGDSSGSGSDSESSDARAHTHTKARGRQSALTLAERTRRIMRRKNLSKYIEEGAEESDGEGGAVSHSDEESGSEGVTGRAVAGVAMAEGVAHKGVRNGQGRAARARDGEDDDDDDDSSDVSRDSASDTSSGDSDSDEDSGVDSADDAASQPSAVRPRRLKRLQDKGVLEDDDYELVAENAEQGVIDLQGTALEKIGARVNKRARMEEGAPSPVPVAPDAVEEAAPRRPRPINEEYDSEGMDEFIDRQGEEDDDDDADGPGKRRRARQPSAFGGADHEQFERVARFDRIFGAGARHVMQTRREGAAGPSQQASISLAALFDDEEEDDGFGTTAARREGAAYLDDEDFDDGDGADAATRGRPARARQGAVTGLAGDSEARSTDPKLRRLERSLEPAVRAAHLIQARDLTIREVDEPERLQTMLFLRKKQRARIATIAASPSAASVARSVALDGASLDDEVAWITERLMSFPAQNVVSPDYDLPSTAVSVLGSSSESQPSVDDVSTMVREVLACLYDKHQDLPYIWTYCRDLLLPSVSYSHLWYIVDLDEEWVRVVDRRVAVGKVIDKAVDAGTCDSDMALRVRELLLTANTSRKVEDVAAYATTMLIAATARLGAGGFAPSGSSKGRDAAVERGAAAGASVKQDLYRLAQVSEVRRVADRLFLPALQLAANIAAGSAVYAVPDTPPGDGEDAVRTLAFDALSAEFSSVDDVLRAARHIAATELAAEPFIRAHFRRFYFERASISTAPTAKGVTEIEATSPYFGVHTLRDKRLYNFSSIHLADAGRSFRISGGLDFPSILDEPDDDEYPSTKFELSPVPVVDGLGLQAGFGSNVSGQRVRPFKDAYVRLEPRVGGFAQYALIARAVREGFITLTVNLDDNSFQEMLANILVFYLSPVGLAHMTSGGDAMNAFDRQRRDAVDTCLRKVLLPAFENDLRTQLARIANETIAAEYAGALRRRVMMAPPVPPPQPLRKRKEDGERARASGAATRNTDGVDANMESLTRYPWQRLRPRLVAVAMARGGDREPDVAVIVDHRGEVQDHIKLTQDRTQREQSLAEFLFAYAPDMIVIGASAGLRARDMRKSIVIAAGKMDALVTAARANYKKRRTLAATHGTDPSRHDDPRVRQAYEATLMDARLEPLAERWTVGRYRYLRPRTPDTSVLQAGGGGLRGAALVENPDATLPVLIVDDEFALVFASSARGAAEFPDHPRRLRAAASLARFIQDPVAEVAYMWARRADMAGPGVAEALRVGVAAVPEDLLGAQLHALQREVPPQMLYAAAERVMVEVVNGTGVDFNFAVAVPHVLPMLQFVSGLGPRKVAALVTQLPGSGGRIRSRNQLVAGGVLTQRVYTNASGFLRIVPPGKEQNPAAFLDDSVSTLARAFRRDAAAADTSGYDPLDATRIPPEYYSIALQICKDGDDGRVTRDEVVPEDSTTYVDMVTDVSAVSQRELARMLRGMTGPQLRADTPLLHRVMPEFDAYMRWAPGMRRPDGSEMEPQDGLASLDLPQFSNILEESGYGRILRVLQLVVAELRAPFRDARRPFEPPSPAALFRLLTRETLSSLRPGVIVPGRVMNVTDRRVRVLLDNALSGFFGTRSVAPDVNLLEAYQLGSIINATVTRVDRREFTLEIVPLSPGALPLSAPSIVDAACDVAAAAQVQQQAATAHEQSMRKYAMETGASTALLAVSAATGSRLVPRAISHPFFKNVVRTEAEAHLQKRPLYECLFRPSSHGPSHLTITWKIAEPNTCVHLDMQEDDKAGLDPAALGRTLRIDGRIYSDLDEVMARHIEAMAYHHRQLRSNRVFRDAPESVVDAELRQRLAEEPGRIPYIISPCSARPGHFQISYIIHSRPHHELVRVTPDGFMWRDKLSPTWQKLVEDFKARCRQRDIRASTAATAEQPRRSRFGGPVDAPQAASASRWGAAAPPPAYEQQMPGPMGAPYGYADAMPAAAYNMPPQAYPPQGYPPQGYPAQPPAGGMLGAPPRASRWG